MTGTKIVFLKSNNFGNAEYFWKNLNIFHHTRKKKKVTEISDVNFLYYKQGI